MYSWALAARLLLLPQLATWLFSSPAGEALYQSLFRQDAFGLTVVFVGLDNFRELFADPNYLALFRTTAIFSVCVTLLGLSVALTLAWFADRLLRGATAVRTLIIWPYAIAPAIAGVLWMFLFNLLGCSFFWLKGLGIDWNDTNGTQAFIAGRRYRGLEADQLQLPVLSGWFAKHPQITDRSRGH